MQAALHLFSLHETSAASEKCSDLLKSNPRDSAAWLLKARSETRGILLQHDTIDIDFEIGTDSFPKTEVSNNSCIRPGTSFRSVTQSQSEPSSIGNKGVKPNTARFSSGYIRPLTAARGEGASVNLSVVNRLSTSSGHVMSSSGRLIRLGTASLVSHDLEQFIDVNRLDLKRFCLLTIFTVLVNIPKALELAVHANTETRNTDWWWKLQLAKCFLKLKRYREAETELKGSLEIQFTDAASKEYPDSTLPQLAKARVYGLLHDMENSIRLYKSVLQDESYNVEAMSCLASSYFINNQPEIAERYFRRILQTSGGKETSNLLNNIGLCGFYSQQYDSIPYFERALELSPNDNESADIWYNISHVAIHVGDFDLACEALKLCVSFNSNHAEGWNNLAVLEFRISGREYKISEGILSSSYSSKAGCELFYNSALVELSKGNIETCFELIEKSLKVNGGGHEKSRLLFNQLNELLTS
ncbi:hypothetical protein BDR26DRAFT_929831 [Obelidium mucronatum]|nr:hypothetical protein BDR26DRAFT_929831 [Obelidium mucronatum]